MNMGQDRQMQMVGGNGGNQFRQYVGQNVRNHNGYNTVQNVGNQNPNRNGNVVAAQAEGNANRNNAAANLDEIEEVNANYILMANLQQASTSGTQTDNAPVYDSDGSAKVHHYDNFYNNDIFNMLTQEENVEQGGGTVEQHPATVEETQNEKLKFDFKIYRSDLLDKQIQLENKIKDLDTLHEAIKDKLQEAIKA
ncbi:hypothetical protein Tco_0156523 [Tanacetum coccineum]